MISTRLTADIAESYLVQTLGFEVPGHERKLVGYLSEGVHGLKQTRHCWNRILDEFSKDSDLTRSMADNCSYPKSDLHGSKFFMCVRVDDTKNFEQILSRPAPFGSVSSEKCTVANKRPMKWFLRFSVGQLPGKINFSQKFFVLDWFLASVCLIANPWMIAKNIIERWLLPALKSDAFRDLSKMRSLRKSLVGKLKYISSVRCADFSSVVLSWNQLFSGPHNEPQFQAKNVLR